MRPDGDERPQKAAASSRDVERTQKAIASFEDLVLVGAKPLVKSRLRNGGLAAPPSAPAPFVYKSPPGSHSVGLLHAHHSAPDLSQMLESPCSNLSVPDVDQVANLPSLAGIGAKDKSAFSFGVLLANVATICFSLQMLCVKLGSRYGPPSMELLLVRFVVHTFATLVCCSLGLFGFHGKFWRFASRRSAMLCASTGLVNTIVIQLLYYATTQLSLALATVLYFTSPVWSGILKTAVMGDAYSWADGFFSALSVVAVATVSLPHASHASGSAESFFVGLVSALLAGALQALAYVIVQLLKRGEEEEGIGPGQRVHWLQINISNAAFGLLATPLTLWGPFKFQDPVGLSGLPILAKFELVGVGVFTVSAQFLLVQSQGYLDVVLVTVIRSLDVMYALIYQTLLISHKVPTFSDTLGCALLIISVSSSAYYSQWAARKLQERSQEGGR